MQQEVGLAGQHVALADLGPALHQGLEGAQVVLRLARQADLGEDGDAEAERRGVEVGVIAADEAGLLERAHAPQAGRRRDAGPLGQLDIGHAAVGLQVAQNVPIDPVELDPHA